MRSYLHALILSSFVMSVIHDPTKSTAKLASFTQVDWQGNTHFIVGQLVIKKFHVF